MKSPRNWALQQMILLLFDLKPNVEMKSPRNWALQHITKARFKFQNRSRNEKPEILGIATLMMFAKFVIGNE